MSLGLGLGLGLGGLVFGAPGSQEAIGGPWPPGPPCAHSKAQREYNQPSTNEASRYNYITKVSSLIIFTSEQLQSQTNDAESIQTYTNNMFINEHFNIQHVSTTRNINV